MYKLFIRLNKGRFMSMQALDTLEKAEEAIKDLSKALGMEEEDFGIATFCDYCEEEREIYSEGCCKECFDRYVSGEIGGAAK